MSNEEMCFDCGQLIEENAVVWADPVTGRATTKEEGKPFHPGCVPDEE
jgi:hypothetical protein